MSLIVARILKKRATPSETATAARTIVRQSDFKSSSSAGVVDWSRSRNGCNSSSTSFGSRVNIERAPSNHGWSAKAENIMAKGGQYSANRFERAVMIINAVEKRRKNN